MTIIVKTSSTAPMLCGHCGRPMFTFVWIAGIPYHYECTQSPYATMQRQDTRQNEQE